MDKNAGNSISIRSFEYSDIEAVVQLAKLSFAEEYEARGVSLDNFSEQVRLASRGRLIPFRMLTTIAGIRWQYFVATVGERIVGFGGYTGRQQMELNTLMVHPDFRRQGIGEALLKARLQHLTQLSYPFVTVSVLENNVASLRNILKQDFQIFDHYTVFETPLPFLQSGQGIMTRPLKKSDHDLLITIEESICTKEYLQLNGSVLPHYQQSWGNLAMRKLMGDAKLVRVFEQKSKTIGILNAQTTYGQTKGHILRPILLDENADYLPAILAMMGNWLTDLERTAVRLVVPLDRVLLCEKMKSLGWKQTHTWLRAYKPLSPLT